MIVVPHRPCVVNILGMNPEQKACVITGIWARDAAPQRAVPVQDEGTHGAAVIVPDGPYIIRPGGGHRVEVVGERTVGTRESGPLRPIPVFRKSACGPALRVYTH